MADTKNELPEICFHAIFEDYDYAFVYAWDNWLNVHIHKTDDEKEFYEVY